MAKKLNRQEVFDKLAKIIKEVLCPKIEITEATRLAEDLGADSLALAEIVMEIEDVFVINIPNDKEGKIKTIGDSVDVILDLLSKQQ